MRMLIAATLLMLTASARGQDGLFEDPDYKFFFKVPDGLLPLPIEDRAAQLGVPVERIENKPRSESETIKLEHTWVWVEPPSKDHANRQIELVLMDETQWAGPGDMENWLRANGIEVVGRESLDRPVGPAKLLECTYANPGDGRLMRMYVVYLPRVNRYAVMKLMCAEEYWGAFGPALRAAVDSVRFRERVNVPEPGEKRDPFKEEMRRRRHGELSWGKHEVWGSLVLSAVIVFVMVAGAKGRS